MWVCSGTCAARSQIPAIRPMQSAGLHEQEIRNQRAHVGHVLDPADEIAIIGVKLLNNRLGACFSVVTDHDVDEIAAEARIFGRVN